MNRYKILCLTLISLLFFSCGESKTKIDQEKADTIIVSDKFDIEKVDSMSNKQINVPFSIDSDSYAIMVRANTKNIADIDKFVLRSFTRLKSGQDQFKYYYIPFSISESFPFNISDSYKTFLILEDYESESAVWLVNYTSDMKLIDALEVYYDNAEGCWQTTSEINRTTIKQTVYDCYADPEETTKEVSITAEGKFKK